MSRFERLTPYWPVGLILAAGLAVVGWLGATGDDLGRIGWACGGIGVLAGAAIAAISGRLQGQSRGK
ncbi:MAG: hypothetical protein ACKVT1_18945 [Dehalococcoidia bacterium]